MAGKVKWSGRRGRGWSAGAALLVGLWASLTASAQEHGHTIGTLQRIDPDRHRLALSLDARTGSELGQGAPLNVYFDPAKVESERGSRPRLQPGDRLMLQTRTTGKRVEADSVRRLADTPGQSWGRYLHGTIGEVVDRTQTLMVDQAETRIRNRIEHGAQTTVFALDGTPMRIDQLRAGDDIDMAFRLQGRVRTATSIVVLRPAGTP